LTVQENSATDVIDYLSVTCPFQA